MRKPIGILFAIPCLGILIAAGTAPAQSQSQAAVATCAASNAEAAIPACTRMLGLKNWSASDRSRLHVHRGVAYSRKRDYDRAIQDFNAAVRLDPNQGRAYSNRGFAYNQKGDYDHAISDLSRAILLEPDIATTYSDRAHAYSVRGDKERARADLQKALELNPNEPNARALLVKIDSGDDLPKCTVSPPDASALSACGRIIADVNASAEMRSRAFAFRGIGHANKGDFDRAVADFDEAIRLDAKLGAGFSNRGFAHFRLGKFDRAAADYGEAIKLAPGQPVPHVGRGAAHKELGKFDLALVDLNESIRLDPKHARAHFHRGDTYRRMGDTVRARADLTRALELNPNEADAKAALARLDAGRDTKPAEAAAKPSDSTVASVAPPAADVAQKPAVTPAGPGSRVALVIGNSNYRHATVLNNPKNDASDLAALLRKLGFDVVEGVDLDKYGMDNKIREFGRKLDNADVALFFYAGHGLQVGGKNYLVPVNALLERAGDLNLDTVEVDVVLAQMEAQKRVNLIFLDACRDNPLTRSFARRLGTRSTSVGQGLAAIQSAIGTMIAYATQPGNVALDGTGRNSPFTAALLKHLGTAGTDIGILMRRVRTDVIAATREQQVPWDHSSLTGEVVLAR